MLVFDGGRKLVGRITISNRIEKNLFALRPTTGGEENE